jgi:hypothetical protein
MATKVELQNPKRIRVLYAVMRTPLWLLVHTSATNQGFSLKMTMNSTIVARVGLVTSFITIPAPL